MITDPEDPMVIAAMSYGRDGKPEGPCLTHGEQGCTHTDCYYAGLLNRAMAARRSERNSVVKRPRDTSSTVKWAAFGWLELCVIENLLTHDDGVDCGPPPEDEFMERRLWQEIQDEKMKRPEAVPEPKMQSIEDTA